MDFVARQSFGRYEITGHLETGGEAIAYPPREAHLVPNVAVKVVNERGASRPMRIERFAQGAQAAARQSHPKTLDIHDLGIHGGITCANTELLQDQTLGDCLIACRSHTQIIRENGG